MSIIAEQRGTRTQSPHRWCRERGAEVGDTIVVEHVPTGAATAYTIEHIRASDQGGSSVWLSDGDEFEEWHEIHPDYQFHLVRKGA